MGELTDKQRLKEFERLTAKQEKDEKELGRAEGALEEILKVARKKFACGSVEELETLVKELRKKTARAGEEFDSALTEAKQSELIRKLEDE